MSRLRRLGAVVLILAALAVYFGLAPTESDYQTKITAARSDYDANNATAQGAPQQAVVNGWIARDLLQILADETATGGSDPRVPALLLIGVLSVLLLALTPEERTAGSLPPPSTSVPQPEPVPPPMR